MVDPKLTLLLRRLHKKTLESKVPWERTVDEGVFQASFKGYSVILFSRPTKQPEPDPNAIDYVLQIFNEDGVLVEEVDDLDFDKNELGQFPYIMMDEIYTSARRTVMGVDKAIDTLLKALDEDN